jgi:hypothetical protein
MPPPPFGGDAGEIACLELAAATAGTLDEDAPDVRAATPRLGAVAAAVEAAGVHGCKEAIAGFAPAAAGEAGAAAAASGSFQAVSPVDSFQ